MVFSADAWSCVSVLVVAIFLAPRSRTTRRSAPKQPKHDKNRRCSNRIRFWSHFDNCLGLFPNLSRRWPQSVCTILQTLTSTFHAECSQTLKANPISEEENNRAIINSVRQCHTSSIKDWCIIHHRRKFRSQTSDNMDRWKAEQGRGREKRKIRREKSRRERVRRKKIQMREKVGKSPFTVFFQWFVAPEGRKVGSLKRRVRSQLARWEMKNCTPLWRQAHLEVKMYKTHQCRTTFGTCDVEKVHPVVARSTFPSQNAQNTPVSDHFWNLRCRKSARRCGAKRISKSNVQNTPVSDHFWKLRCRKSARRCGAKHIFKSKCRKHTSVRPLLEVAMSKKCAPLWREAHFQVKMYKTPPVRATFGCSDVEKVHAVVARSTFRSQKCKKLRVLSLFWR